MKWLNVSFVQGGTQDMKTQSAHDSLDSTSAPGDQSQTVVDGGRPFNPSSNESAWSSEKSRNELRKYLPFFRCSLDLIYSIVYSASR